MSDLESLLPLLAANGLDVVDPELDLVICPGIHLHTKENADADCRVYNNNGVPRLHCFHGSCRPVVDAVNKALFNAARAGNRIQYGTGGSKEAMVRKKAVEAARRVKEREQQFAAKLLPGILRDYDWPANAIVADSSEEINLPVERHWQAVLSLFDDDDVIWVGRDKHDSGTPGHRWRFRPAVEWLAERACPGALICPSAFRPGIYERTIEHVVAPRFLVVESDSLNHDQVGAVFRWIANQVGLQLRAVVDSGNKSLHGWFGYPAPEVLEKLLIWLPAMGCDETMFRVNQPCRLPGAIRLETGRYQRLLYLA